MPEAALRDIFWTFWCSNQVETQRNGGTDAFQFHFEWTGVSVCHTDNETQLSNIHEKGNPDVSHKHPTAKKCCFYPENEGRGRKRWKKHTLMRWRSEVELRMSPEAYQDWPVAKTVRSPPQAQETPSKVNWGRKIGEVHASTAAKNRSDVPRNTNPEHSGKDFRLVEKIRAGN